RRVGVSSFPTRRSSDLFVEMSEELAREKGINPGDMVKVWSNRGTVKGKAVVTKRLKPLTINGKVVHTVGLPLNFGFIGETKKARSEEHTSELQSRENLV